MPFPRSIRLVPSAACALVALAFAALGTRPATALPPTPTQMMLREATSAADLRARLVAYARGAESSDRIGAGEAWYFIGQSYARGTKPDSAILAYRRANELRGTYEDRYELAAALLDRQAPGDIDEGVALAEASVKESQVESARTAVRFRALLAWGKLLAGEKETARTMFEGVEADITLQPLWRYRYARAELTGANVPKAIQLLRPLAVASRVQAGEVMQLLEMAGQRLGQSEQLDRDLAEKMATRDKIEEQVVTRIAGRRIKFAASDQFPLSGVLLESSVAGRRHPAIVLMAPGDTLADYDSLGVALRSSGFHTLLVAARGSGWSVGPDTPLPHSWRGREEALLRRSALDYRDAMRAVSLAIKGKVDTSGVVLVASRSMALAGALAASQNPRVRALVLLSPDPDLVDRGPVVAALAKRRIPVFIQQTLEDYPNFEFVDLVYHAANEPVSRVSEGRAGGHGAIAFKQDHRVGPRFTQWLAEAMKVAPATPRSQPRKG